MYPLVDCGHLVFSPIGPNLRAHWPRPTSYLVSSQRRGQVFLVAPHRLSNGAAGFADDPGLGWHLRNIDAIWRRVVGSLLIRFANARRPLPNVVQQSMARRNSCSGSGAVGGIGGHCGRRGSGDRFHPAACIESYYATVRPGRLRCFGPRRPRWASPVRGSLRPNLFTMFFVLVTARICVLFHEGRCSRLRSLWLLPLFAVWANIHGGFVAGFTLLGGTLLIERRPFHL